MTMTRACKTCQWWDAPALGDGLLGYCHGSPPTAIRDAVSEWPVTEDQDWCGAHQICAELVGGDVRKPHPHQDGEA